MVDSSPAAVAAAMKRLIEHAQICPIIDGSVRGAAALLSQAHAAGVAEGLATAAAICEAHAAKIAAAAPKSPFILAHRLDVEAILAASPAREPE